MELWSKIIDFSYKMRFRERFFGQNLYYEAAKIGDLKLMMESMNWAMVIDFNYAYGVARCWGNDNVCDHLVKNHNVHLFAGMLEYFHLKMKKELSCITGLPPLCVTYSVFEWETVIDENGKKMSFIVDNMDEIAMVGENIQIQSPLPELIEYKSKKVNNPRWIDVALLANEMMTMSAFDFPFHRLEGLKTMTSATGEVNHFFHMCV